MFLHKFLHFKKNFWGVIGGKGRIVEIECKQSCLPANVANIQGNSACLSKFLEAFPPRQFARVKQGRCPIPFRVTFQNPPRIYI